MRNDRPVGRLRALGALVLLLAVVVGAPAAILAVFGWPLTRGVLEVRRWPDALTATELSDDAIVRVFVTLALVVLVYLLGCALAEVVALVRRTERPLRTHNPLSGWIRHLVAVAAVLLSTARPVASLPSAGAPAPPAAVTAVAPSAVPGTAGLRGLPAPATGLAVVDGRLADARDARAGTVTVEAGRRDSLYSLAVRHLGDGDRRDELLELNRGRVMADGSTFDGTVRPGYTILVPAGPATATGPVADESVAVVAAAATGATDRTHVVEVGDSLWSIAERLLGDGELHERIHEANLGREVAPGVAYLSTTEVIRPGWTLVIPALDAPAATAEPVAGTAAGAGGVHEVRPGESLWSIAEDVLAADGTPGSASEVAGYVARTAEANADRFVRPGHPELIRPGQQLDLPPIDAAVDAPTPAPAVGAPVEAPAGTGPGTVSVAPPASAAPLPPPAPVMPPPLSPPLPTAAPTVVAGPVVSPTPSADAVDAVDAAVSVDDAADDGADDAGPELALPGLVGAAVLASGALGAVLRLRHQRLNRRRPGTRIEAPGDQLAYVERVLRAQADAELARWGPRALRHLAPRLGAEWDGSFPMVAEVGLRADGLTLTWTAPRPTGVAPWRVSADGYRWELDRMPAGVEPDVADGVVPPCPGLVTVGCRDDAPLLVDIEAAGLISVSGPAERVAAFGRSLVLELAVSDFADLLDIRLVGLPDDGFEHLGRVHAVSALDQAMAWARPLRLATDELLDEQGVASLFEMRARQGPRAVTHEPLVLVVAPGVLDDAAVAELRRVCAPGRGVVAVVLGPVDAPVRVALDVDGQATIARAGADDLVVAAPALVPEATLEAVGALLAHAADADEHAEPTPLPVRRDQPFVEPEAAVEVRLLGPVAIGRWGGPDLDEVPARTLELVAWLATHRGAEPAARLRADVWPGRDGGARTLNQHVTAARTLLGADGAGRLLLPPPVDDRYRLAEAVVTDVERLERRLRWAATATDATAVEVLRDGLALVRGRPFTVRRGYGWAFADQLVFRAEQLVVDAAHRLGTLALTLADPAGAVWATGVGLLGRPGDETLYQLRMRAFAALGNQGSVRQAMNQLCTELQDLAGIDEPSDETTELYEQLLGRERSA